VKQRGRLAPERVAFALFVSHSKREAARLLGVAESTIYKYLSLPEVRAEIRRLRELSAEYNAANAAEAIALAISTLRQLLDNPSTNDFVKVRAADVILSRLQPGLLVEESVEFVDDFDDSNDPDNEDN
jgi:transcription initiation factor TFIIIB Brf1 subunit/transcription initiation factor TFIIB